MGLIIAMQRRCATLAPVEAAIVIHTLLVSAFFVADPQGLIGSAIMIFVLSLFSGVLTEAEYPIAVNLASPSGQGKSTIGGKLYATDLGSAFFGAITTSVFLLPAVGIKNALLMITALKGRSLAMAYLSEKR